MTGPPAGADDPALEQALQAQLAPHAYLDGWRCRYAPAAGADAPASVNTVAVAPSAELPRVFRTGNLRLFHAASCPFRYSSRTSCGVRYPSVEWRRVLL